MKQIGENLYLNKDGKTVRIVDRKELDQHKLGKERQKETEAILKRTYAKQYGKYGAEQFVEELKRKRGGKL